jgi:hypothetical protein
MVEPQHAIGSATLSLSYIRTFYITRWKVFKRDSIAKQKLSKRNGIFKRIKLGAKPEGCRS